MTVVNLTALETLLGAPGPIATGLIVVEYWAGSGPFVQVEDDEVTFPAPIHVAIVDGEPAEVLDLVPTVGAGCCVRWLIATEGGGFQLLRFTAIPASASPIDFEDLPVVDPATFAPASNPTILESLRVELLDGLRFEKVTQAEYDALPTPRPADVIYVVPLV